MSREQANERLWQFKPVRSAVEADEFVGITPFHPADIEVHQQGSYWVIEGMYGIDIFPNHKFVLRVNGKLETYTRLEDIPFEFDNVINFAPDDTHDITFCYRFRKQGDEFEYTHWIHHDMSPWEKLLPELIARETNGGWNRARSN